MPGRIIRRESVPDYLHEQEERERPKEKPKKPTTEEVVKGWVKKGEQNIDPRRAFANLFTSPEEKKK